MIFFLLNVAWREWCTTERHIDWITATCRAAACRVWDATEGNCLFLWFTFLSFSFSTFSFLRTKNNIWTPHDWIRFYILSFPKFRVFIISYNTIQWENITRKSKINLHQNLLYLCLSIHRAAQFGAREPLVL